ncbi:MAG: hypothetical protein MPK62_15495, partial [Alphaproteobacteria bacterium]|nr:hypothetical protein [Alphaproteobacteria bacterium]
MCIRDRVKTAGCKQDTCTSSPWRICGLSLRTDSDTTADSGRTEPISLPSDARTAQFDSLTVLEMKASRCLLLVGC